MKFDQLAYFVETAKHEHLGRAARALAISPSAISHAIAGLEGELGQKLFSREGKRIYLTDFGQRFRARATETLRSVDELKEEFTAATHALEGNFRLGGSHGLSVDVLTPAWARLTRAHPGLTAEILTLRSSEVVDRTAAGELDCGLCFSPQPHPRLQSATLGRDELVFIVRAGHPLLKIKPAARAMKLSRFPAALPKAFRGIDNCETHPLFDKLKITPQIALAFDSYEVALSFIHKTDAWGFVPRVFLRAASPRCQKLLRESAPVELTAVWPRGRPLSRALKALIGGLKQTRP